MAKTTKQTAEDIAELKDKFVVYFKDVPVQKYAAMYIGRTEQTIINWLKDDQEFFNRVQEAKADWVKKKVTKVKAEFALERLEFDVFKQRSEQDLNHNGEVKFINDVPRPKNS